ncbi:ANO5-like protein [Mya arenaria]|uniref:Anoctamin n=1 Tax=Mya arenaria TaxID=6604 RepID=A0ABY7EKQ8_MYAAR|nr:ANO5-like protein [Mya arenaria]
MDHQAIGFELANAGPANASVAPAPPQGGLYPAMDPRSQAPPQGGMYPAMDSGYQPPPPTQAPIGFEMSNMPHDNGGPTEVVSDNPPPGGVKGSPEEEETMYFKDNRRRIDYVLASEVGSSAEKENRVAKRKYFIEEIQKMGLELEFEDAENSKSGKVAFIKCHAPWDVLAKGAELMNMKMPLADLIEEDDNYFTAPFNRRRMEQFVIKDRDSFFTNAQRSRIVYAILARAFYEDEDPNNPGKRRFGQISQRAFDPYEGKTEQQTFPTTRQNQIGIYFTWLGYYTMMLVPAAIVGVVAFIYGLVTMWDDQVTNDLCDASSTGNLTMCPLCDGRCTYWRLTESCVYSRATYLFDNPATVAFACFMALWASFFHEFWKRKQAELEYEWDVADFEEEEETVRPEFENTVRRKRENPVNKKLEPYVPKWSKCCRYSTTLFILLFFFALVLMAIVGVILYRIIIAALLYHTDANMVKGRAGIISSATAACINLVIIVLLNFVYQKIAEGLTELEQHRTESEWEDAFTFKMFLFQFVNYYSSIIYISFFKGKFVGRPGDYNRSFFGYRQEECDPAGCLIELCIQLGIIMVGKQAFANFKEVILPKLVVWCKSRSVLKDKEDKVYTHWEQDYNLADQPKLGLFDEYLEMVIQYGFVTIFVAAFPLAPFFALINNIIEIRLDAYKFVTQWKRPLAVRAQDIGIWFGILQGVSAIAVVSNAAIIAFTSEFIPRMVYKYGYSSDQSMHGYYETFRMSKFDISGFHNDSRPTSVEPEFGNLSICISSDSVVGLNVKCFSSCVSRIVVYLSVPMNKFIRKLCMVLVKYFHT